MWLIKITKESIKWYGKDFTAKKGWEGKLKGKAQNLVIKLWSSNNIFWELIEQNQRLDSKYQK